MAAVPTQLRALAEHAGILARYLDNAGQVRETNDDTRRLVLACLGFDAADEASACRTLAGLHAARAALVVDPVCVVHEADSARIPASSRVLTRGEARYEVIAIDETSGEERVSGGVARVRANGAVAELLGPSLAPGTYRLAIRLEAGGRHEIAEQWRAVVPARCKPLAKAIGRRRAFGIWSSLYALRSARGVGVGNLEHLGRLVAFANRAGAEFVGINPLHALRNRGAEVSPYSPLSRLFRNPIYVAPECVPEFAASDRVKKLMGSPGFARELAEVRKSERLDYERIASLQTPILEALWRTFRVSASTQRMRAFKRYCDDEGSALRDFATFCAIEERLAAGRKPRDWRRWPAALRDPGSAAVAELRVREADRVEFHCFVQFECDRQLGLVARTAERGGMAIGLYADMAVGSIASSFDAWAFPGLLVDGASLGAPPDPYSSTGQIWALPPLNPHRLRADGYRYWRAMLRAAFRHCGMLRLDHAMGVLRQFWVPDGHSGAGGVYVAFPAGDLLGLLALESRRAGAVVVAEDLGTVPEGFSELLAQHEILSSNVMFFERTRRGGFVAARRYSHRALLTANTHDQPTLAGWWKGRDLEIHHTVGMIADDAELARARARREREKGALVRRLRTERALARARDAGDAAELCAAVNRYLSAAPSPLIGVSLDDLAGETEPVNVPGIGPDRYPSWSRRMHVAVEELAGHPAVSRALSGVASRAHKRLIEPTAPRGRVAQSRESKKPAPGVTLMAGRDR